MPVHFPAFCPHCGLIFQAGGIAIAGDVSELTLANVRQRCPRCRKWAQLPDGTFDVVGDTIHVLRASELTRERLLRLQEILEAASRGEITDEAATRAVTKEAPEFESFFARLRPKMGRALIYFVLLVVQTLVQQTVAEHRDHAATRADIENAVETAVQRCQEHAP